MSIWKSDEKLFIFASLISPSTRRIFNSLLGVSSGDETPRLMLDVLHENTMHPICR